MALNTQVASILQQAAVRRKGVVKVKFQPNPDASDHSERKVDYHMILEGPDGKDSKPVKGLLVIEDKTLDSTPMAILNRLTESKGEPKDEEGGKFLETTLRKLLEM